MGLKMVWREQKVLIYENILNSTEFFVFRQQWFPCSRKLLAKFWIWGWLVVKASLKVLGKSYSQFGLRANIKVSDGSEAICYIVGEGLLFGSLRKISKDQLDTLCCDIFKRIQRFQSKQLSKSCCYKHLTKYCDNFKKVWISLPYNPHQKFLRSNSRILSKTFSKNKILGDSNFVGQKDRIHVETIPFSLSTSAPSNEWSLPHPKSKFKTSEKSAINDVKAIPDSFPANGTRASQIRR